MPNQAHNRAAAFHENAAKSHRAAAAGKDIHREAGVRHPVATSSPKSWERANVS